MLFKKLFNQAFFLLIARILFRVSNAFVAIIVARYLGVEKFGIYSTALALVNTFLISNDIGSTTLLLREGSRDKNKIETYLGNSILIQLIATALFFALCVIIGFTLGYDPLTMLLVVLLGGATVVFEFRKSFRVTLRILLKLKFVAIMEIFIGTGILLGTYLISLFVFNKDLGLILIALTPFVFNIILIISLIIYNLKFTNIKFDKSKIWPMIKDGYIYSAYNIFYIIYFQISILMVQYMLGNTAAGLYSAASKLIILLLIVPQMIFQVGLPLMFKFAKSDLEKYKRIHHFIFRYLNAFALPAAVGIWLLADQFILIVYKGNEFLPAGKALQVFSIFLVIRFFGNVAGQSLTTQDKQRQKVIVQFFSLIILVISNYFFIKAYGFIGAVYGTLISESVIRLSFMFMDLKYLKESWFKYLKELVIPVSGALIMGILIYFTKNDLNVIFSVFLGAISYGLCLWIFKFIKPYDKKLFKQLKK